MTIETDDTTDPQHLIPLQGYPGQQEHQTCDECDGLYHVKEVVWESERQKRVSLKCDDCGHITVSNKENQMFRHTVTVSRD